MYIPTIYNKDIDETSHPLTLNDDKLHHLRNVLRVKNNSPIKNIKSNTGHLRQK